MNELQNPEHPIKILTIDDEESVRRSLTFFLEDAGYEVYQASNGHEGLDLATRTDYDLVLLDLRMPDLDGLQTLGILQRERPDTPVVVISGTGDIQSVVEALRRGACDYLTKPLTDMTVLKHAVNRALERSRLRQENLSYQESLETKVTKRTSELETAYVELATSKQTLEALFQAAPLGIVLLDEEHRVTLWNHGAEQLFGWNEEEILDVGCPCFAELESAVLEQIFTPGFTSRELTLRHRTGAQLTVNLSSAWLDTRQPEVGGIVLLFEDIRDKKRLQSEADRAGRLASLGQLSAGVAHEINNPNGLMLLNIPTLRDVLDDALTQLAALTPDTRVGGLPLDRARQIVPQLTDEVEDGARRISQIVEDLKNFARSDASEEKTLFDLNLSLERARRLTTNTIRKTTDRFSCELEKPLPSIRGNPHRIEQVIVNLLVNACEALPNRTAALHVMTHNRPDLHQVELQVIDEGIGISAEDMGHITDPFFTTRRESGGTGLGLSVSARIIREHGGHLEFESKPGRGTCVTLRLPVAEETP